MGEKPQYVSVAPGIADQKHVEALGKAETLFLFLVHYQRDSDGVVNYGKPITYDWIRERFPGAKLRTLQRWMDRLREGGYIETANMGHGFLVRITHQKKFPVRQLSLYPQPEPFRKVAGAK
jgi:hypothetical protein